MFEESIVLAITVDILLLPKTCLKIIIKTRLINTDNNFTMLKREYTDRKNYSISKVIIEKQFDIID